MPASSFFLSVLLFPASLEDYSGYEHYFMSRRAWFFGFLALAFLVDLVGTAVKGKAYFESFGMEYPLRNAAYIALCIIAAMTPNRRFHAVFFGGWRALSTDLDVWSLRSLRMIQGSPLEDKRRSQRDEREADELMPTDRLL